MKRITLLFAALFCTLISLAQGQGLEGVIVETYYISDANDATDTDGGSLPEGSVTYRVFMDLAEGYELQAVFGNEAHTLNIGTSTTFFNNEDRGEQTGDAIPENRLDENTVALDSWLGMSGASGIHLGVPKAMDTDGSIVGGTNNDGGSEGVADGLMVNQDPLAGIPLTTADGLIEGDVPTVTVVGLDLAMFGDENDGPLFTSNGGAWSVLEGVQGPTDDNIVLVAQLTTDGDLSFELNIQLGTPDGGTEQFVASNASGDETFFNALNFPLPPLPGCTSATACNFNPEASEDDGSCIEPVADCQACNQNNDGLEIIDTDGDGVCDAEEIAGCDSPSACNYNPEATDLIPCIEPIENCQACNMNNDGLEIVDTDGDGICDAEEVPGCTSITACNYNPEASEDDGSCIEPEENCTECNANNDGLDIIDSDGDGTCDALENPGCNQEEACNYDPEATGNDGSCIIPVENCSICNENNDGLIIVDTDGDGVCDAEEISGCTSSTACNFNELATDEDNSCIEPVEDCQACNENNDGLEIIDSDGDGVCDAEEILGCTSSSACNFNELATDDDDSCIEPVEDCQACNENNDGLEIIDTDGDGVCDAEEIFGCTDPEAINYNPEATEEDGSCIFPNVEEQNLNFNMEIYPNPATQFVMIRILENNGGDRRVKVMNLLGEVLIDQELSFSTGEEKLDLTKLSSGVYLVQISDNTYSKTKRLIIE